jgi:cytochrome c5
MRRPELAAGLSLLLAGCSAQAPTPAPSVAGTASEASLPATLQTAEADAIDKLPSGHGRDVVLGSCLICHSAGIIVQQHKDAAAWTRTLRQMIAWGAPLPSSEEAAVAAYLAEHFGPLTPGR